MSSLPPEAAHLVSLGPIASAQRKPLLDSTTPSPLLYRLGRATLTLDSSHLPVSLAQQHNLLQKMRFLSTGCKPDPLKVPRHSVKSAPSLEKTKRNKEEKRVGTVIPMPRCVSSLLSLISSPQRVAHDNGYGHRRPWKITSASSFGHVKAPCWVWKSWPQ